MKPPTTHINQKLLRIIESQSEEWGVFEFADGLRLWTNKHIIVPTEIDPGVSSPEVRMWQNGILKWWTPKLKPGRRILPRHLLNVGTGHFRRFGQTLIDERYVRLFPLQANWYGGSGVRPSIPYRVTFEGQQIGIVQPAAPPGRKDDYPSYPVVAQEDVPDEEIYR